MDISSILNIGFGSTGVESTFGSADPASEINFGDVLGSALSANAVDTDMQSSGVTEEIITEDGFSADDKKSFAELVASFKDDVDKAGEGVIAAAVKMMLSVGNASQRFMNGTSEKKLADDEDGGEDVISVLSGMISLVISDPEEDYVSNEETGLALLLADVSEVIRGGIKEGKKPEEIVAQFKKLAEDGDEDMNALVQAVVSMMSELSGAENPEVLPDEEITFEGAAKTAAVTLVLSEDAPNAKKAETILSVIKDNTNFRDEKTFESFIESVKLAFSSEKTAQTDSGIADTFGSVHKTAAYARINDVSAQLGRLIGGTEKDTAVDFTVNTAPEAAVPAFKFPETAVPEIEIPEDTVTVYKELADFAVEQITRTVLDDPQNDAVKELTVVLKPENLGEIAVKLTQDASGTISVVLAASNQEIGRALAANASALSESFAKQNMDVDTVNVVNPSEAAAYMGLDFTNQGFERRNNDAQQARNSTRGNVSSVGSIEDADESEVTTAKKLLKEARLWLMA